MTKASQAQPPTRPPAYVIEWVGARVECSTTRGTERGTVSDARRFRSVDKMVTRLNVLLDSGGIKYALDSEVIKIAAPNTEHMRMSAYGRFGSEGTAESGSNGQA